jgi:hypothetical protein
MRSDCEVIRRSDLRACHEESRVAVPDMIPTQALEFLFAKLGLLFMHLLAPRTNNLAPLTYIIFAAIEEYYPMKQSIPPMAFRWLDSWLDS